MIAHLNGDYETVDFTGNRSVLMYDNVEEEDYPTHWHNAIEIIMPLMNDFRVICGGTEYLLDERDIMIIPAGELHSLCARNGRRLIFICDNAAVSDNPALSDLQTVISKPLHISKGSDPDFLKSLNQYMTDMYILYSDFNEMSEIYIYIKLLSMLARIKEYMLNSVKYDDDGKYADKFRMILKFIDSNYMYDISLDSLARMAGYSKYHFSRIFKKYSSDTFINFVNRRRIKAAELLLLEANLSVTDIAMRSGFSSLTTFNRIFKDVKGCTPSEYKKLYKVTETSERPDDKRLEARYAL